jgi:aryl-alcohol dehydrogenase-like predicted oxidoreductase
VLRKKGVTSPIVAAAKVEHLTDAVAALSLKLAADEIERLEAPYVLHKVSGF